MSLRSRVRYDRLLNWLLSHRMIRDLSLSESETPYTNVLVGPTAVTDSFMFTGGVP